MSANRTSLIRTRWAAIGAAVAVSLGAGGIGLSHAAIGSGDKPVFVPIEPCRLVDTRGTVGPRTAPLGPGEIFTLQITGSTGECTGIPADAAAAALNVTAIRGTEQSFLTVYPADAAAIPNASNLNWRGGDPPTPNKVDVKLGAGGDVRMFNSVGTVHIAADLVGYYIDHHHDDRYYRKGQVDAAVDAATPIAAFAGGTSSTDLTSPGVVQSVTLVAPATGVVIANSSVTVILDANDEAGCALSTGTALDGDFAQYEGNRGASTIAADIANVRHFDVTAGSVTVNLVCDATIGPEIRALRPQVSLLFVPG